MRRQCRARGLTSTRSTGTSKPVCPTCFRAMLASVHLSNIWMFKLGIYTLDGLCRERLNGFWASRVPLSIVLYAEVAEGNHPDRDEILERILRDFTTREGAFKRTYAGRFRHFDEATVDVIVREFAGKRALRVHDVGASDGRTSCDFFERLAALPGKELTFLASDALPFVTIISRHRLIVAVDEAGAPLQVTRPPFVLGITCRERPWLFPVNALVRRLLLRSAVPKLLRDYHRGDADVTVRELSLVHPKMATLVGRFPNMRFEQYDLRMPMDRTFDVVRAMNLLNPDCFSESDLVRGIGNLFASLGEHGILVVGTNAGPDSPVEGAIYRKSGATLEEVFRAEGPPPVHDLLTSRAWPVL